MPHLILEFSENVIEEMELLELFKECHELLADRLSTSLKSCKSRAYQCEDYSVGDGHPDNAFIHVTLKIMPGRSPELLQTTGEALLELLKKYFAESLKKLKLEITLEIVELRGPYFKTNG